MKNTEHTIMVALRVGSSGYDRYRVHIDGCELKGGSGCAAINNPYMSGLIKAIAYLTKNCDRSKVIRKPYDTVEGLIRAYSNIADMEVKYNRRSIVVMYKEK